jgi:predicted Rossmann-fold nucleotide-binding protein
MNSVREDVILTVAFGGIIYTPGSAGTLQEIFQDAVQNHYLSLGFSSPMIFMGKKFWTDDVPVWPLIQHLVATGRYKNMLLTLSDDPAEIENVLLNFQKRIPQKIGG